MELRWLIRNIVDSSGTVLYRQKTLQTRSPEGPKGEQWDGPWEDVPEEQDYDDGH